MADNTNLSRPLREQVLVALAALAGFTFTYLVLTLGVTEPQNPHSHRFAATNEFTLWVFLSGAQTGYWAIAAPLVWRWARKLGNDYTAPREHRGLSVLSAVAWVLLVVVPIVLFDEREGIKSPLQHFAFRVRLLSGIGLLVAIAAVLGFSRVLLAAGDPSWRHRSQQSAIDDFVELQGTLRGFLTILGGMVTLAVITTGARYQAENAYNSAFRPSVERTPNEVLLVLGGLLAAVLALLYLPTYFSLQRRGDILVEHYAPLPAAMDDTFLDAATRRDRLAGLLDLGGNARSNLESATLILSPLIGGILASFLQT